MMMYKFICPYCGDSHLKDSDDLPWEDYAEIKHECSNCQKEFTIRAKVSIRHEVLENEDL